MMGLLLLGEALPAAQWLAIAIIIVSSIGATMSASRTVPVREQI